MFEKIVRINNINNDLGYHSKILFDRTLGKLMDAGLGIGEDIQVPEGTYEITEYRFEVFMGFADNVCHVNVSLYGNKLRKDGTYGTHVHYISTYIPLHSEKVGDGDDR